MMEQIRFYLNRSDTSFHTSCLQCWAVSAARVSRTAELRLNTSCAEGNEGVVVIEVDYLYLRNQHITRLRPALTFLKTWLKTSMNSTLRKSKKETREKVPQLKQKWKAAWFCINNFFSTSSNKAFTILPSGPFDRQWRKTVDVGKYEFLQVEALILWLWLSAVNFSISTRPHGSTISLCNITKSFSDYNIYCRQ